MTLERNKRTRFSEQDRKDRLAKLKNKTGVTLPSYQTCAIDPRAVAGHVENYIGTVSIPVGLVGPLNFNFKDLADEIYAPIATTEGALVSSVQRGTLAMNLSGGVVTRSVDSRMIRAPQFSFKSIDAALQFKYWIIEKKSELEKLVSQRSRYCLLKELEPMNVGRSVHCRFIYSTGNAAGQNMTTFATSLLCQFLLDEWSEFSTVNDNLAMSDFIIEGNLASDKKVTYWSASQGRGRSVIAECVLKASVVKRVLKMDPQTFVDRFQATKSAQSSAGFLGYNINIANVVAGLFASTGQDLACIHESSVGTFELSKLGDDILATLQMPSLVVGTIGGGVALPSFRDNLKLLGCDHGEGSADRLAQIICGYALALEISTVSAIGSNTFVQAHEKYGRSTLSETLSISDLNSDFFRKNFNEGVKSIKKIKADNKQGYMTEMARQVSKNYSGMLAFEVETENKIQKTFLKLKASDREVIHGCARIVESINPGLAELLIRNRRFLPFNESHLREIEVLSAACAPIQDVAPKFFGSFIDNKKEVFILMQELLENHTGISDLDLSKSLTLDQEYKILEGILNIHSYFYNKRELAFGLFPRLFEFCDGTSLDEQEELWFGLSLLVERTHKDKFKYFSQNLDFGLDRYAELIQELKLQNQTLIHFDFNPRNMAFNFKTDSFFLFDWEFAAWGVPQRDLIEWVIFTSSSNDVIDRLERTIKFSYEKMTTSHALDPILWRRGFQLSYMEFLVRRLPFYVVLGGLGLNINVESFYGILDELGRYFDQQR